VGNDNLTLDKISATTLPRYAEGEGNSKAEKQGIALSRAIVAVALILSRASSAE
jgi:hypothetical protein